jgi:hypothetical protein
LTPIAGHGVHRQAQAPRSADERSCGVIIGPTGGTVKWLANENDARPPGGGRPGVVVGEARDAALDDEPRSEEVQAEEDATPPARASTANGIKPPTADGPKPRRVDLLAEVLCEAKRSLTVAEMRAPMRAKGYGVGMEDHILYNSIYTALVKWSDRFRRIEGNRWELIE